MDGNTFSVLVIFWCPFGALFGADPETAVFGNVVICLK